ncbi:redoxin domain-containing protein [Luteimonas dalianensis]|uniref:TlpA family protein disulfide reductase n=1 Tax=Luteimonas dalianensis TaxID=1148196 RepID=UPI003BF4218F
MKIRWWLVAILGCGLLAGCQREEAAEVPAPTPAPEPVQAADPAEADDPALPDMPALQVTTLDGHAWDLAGQRGKWVVVNYWATWCAPCREEMPELSALASMREHIEVIGLAYEEIEPDAMQAFLDEFPVTYPIAIVGTYDPPADFDTPRGLPMTWLIAPDGSVARRFLGPVHAREIEAAIAEAGGPAVPADPEETAP